MPRVGILVECGPDGLEVHVCGKICALLQQRTGIVIEHTVVPMDNTTGLREGSGGATQNLTFLAEHHLNDHGRETVVRRGAASNLARECDPRVGSG
jgi:hypothetical protein